MTELAITLGQCSGRGRKASNQDFYGAVVPRQPSLGTKGIAIALADGISSSEVSGVASETAVKSFLDDYYCTSDAWSVKTSATRVINAANDWLHVQTARGRHPDDPDRGYVCTFDALVLHSATAHVFHIGDARVYRMEGGSQAQRTEDHRVLEQRTEDHRVPEQRTEDHRVLEQMTEDHRVAVSREQSYLGRALGANRLVEIDYHSHPLRPGDHFVLATDGIHEKVDPAFIAQTIRAHQADLDAAAACIVARALAAGSQDNATIQIVRIDSVPAGSAAETMGAATALPLPPLLEPRMAFDGYTIIRPLYASSRSHVYLARTDDDGTLVAIKIPAIDIRADAAHLRRLMMEEWIARRVDSPHVLRAAGHGRPRRFLYVVTEYVEGQTLGQWLTDHPQPDLQTVRAILDQITRGLQALHRKGMLHQDLRPENILIDVAGTARIIDFGSVRISGVSNGVLLEDRAAILGTMQFTAPEYFLGEAGTTRSDLFSLGVIAYIMLTGQLPYGAEIAKTNRRAQQRRLAYRSAMLVRDDIPSWVDGALEKAVRIDPIARYPEGSEFLADLRHPNDEFINGSRALLRRNPLLFWKLTSAVLLVAVLALAHRLAAGS